MTPKLSQNQKLKLKKTQKIKAVQLNEYTLKQFLNLAMTPKQPIRVPKSQKEPKIKLKVKSQNRRNYRKKDVQLHEKNQNRF